MSDNLKLLPVSVVVKRLASSKSTVYRLIACGDLGAVRTGEKKGLRVPAADLDLFLTRRHTFEEFEDAEQNNHEWRRNYRE
jgi:excisionase family DNA binding protein